MSEFKNVDEIREALETGKIVFWCNESYQVLISSDSVPEKNLFSQKNETCLRVTCMSNWFGSRISPTDISNCYTKKGN